MRHGGGIEHQKSLMTRVKTSCKQTPRPPSLLRCFSDAARENLHVFRQRKLSGEVVWSPRSRSRDCGVAAVKLEETEVQEIPRKDEKKEFQGAKTVISKKMKKLSVDTLPVSYAKGGLETNWGWSLADTDEEECKRCGEEERGGEGSRRDRKGVEGRVERFLINPIGRGGIQHDIRRRRVSRSLERVEFGKNNSTDKIETRWQKANSLEKVEIQRSFNVSQGCCGRQAFTEKRNRGACHAQVCRGNGEEIDRERSPFNRWEVFEPGKRTMINNWLFDVAVKKDHGFYHYPKC